MPISRFLESGVHEVLQALESAARRAAQEFMHASLKYRYAHPDGDDDPNTPTKPPELHAAVRKLLTVQWLHTPGGAPKVELTPPFAAALDAERQAAAAAQPTIAHT